MKEETTMNSEERILFIQGMINNEVMKYVIISFMGSLFVVLFFVGKLGLSTYSLVMLIYGVWLLISGGAIKFRPHIIVKKLFPEKLKLLKSI